jgi:hypothetical protein
VSGSAASALPIQYDESVDGPLPTSSEPSFSFGPQLSEFLPLDAGVNHIVGTATVGDIGVPQFDLAPIILPDGLSIASITLSVTNLRGDGTLSRVAPMRYSYDAAVTSILTSVPGDPSATNGLIDVPLVDALLFAGFHPPAGNFGLGFSGFSGEWPEGTSTDFDYAWTIAVVPEPATAVLLAGGFVAIALCRRTRARAAATRA